MNPATARVNLESEGAGPESTGAQATQLTGGQLTAAISRAMVQLVRDYTGRGPTKAYTTIRDNVILVMLEHTLTKGEQSLAQDGREDVVSEIREEFQNGMDPRAVQQIQALTGRTVVASMSANSVDPDLVAEIFVLDGPLTWDD